MFGINIIPDGYRFPLQRDKSTQSKHGKASTHPTTIDKNRFSEKYCIFNSFVNLKNILFFRIFKSFGGKYKGKKYFQFLKIKRIKKVRT